MDKITARFISKLRIDPETDCWNYTGSISGTGYGNFWIFGHYESAHRIAYFLFKGYLPDDLFVCHHCDNKRCCNPDHLFLGTQKDNMIDSKNKGRRAKGEDNGSSKLTNMQVVEIKELLQRNIPHSLIAVIYKVSLTSIYNISSGLRWSHIKIRENT